MGNLNNNGAFNIVNPTTGDPGYYQGTLGLTTGPYDLSTVEGWNSYLSNQKSYSIEGIDISSPSKFAKSAKEVALRNVDVFQSKTIAHGFVDLGGNIGKNVHIQVRPQASALTAPSGILHVFTMGKNWKHVVKSYPIGGPHTIKIDVPYGDPKKGYRFMGGVYFAATTTKPTAPPGSTLLVPKNLKSKKVGLIKQLATSPFTVLSATRKGGGYNVLARAMDPPAVVNPQFRAKQFAENNGASDLNGPESVSSPNSLDGSMRDVSRAVRDKPARTPDGFKTYNSLKSAGNPVSRDEAERIAEENRTRTQRTGQEGSPEHPGQRGHSGYSGGSDEGGSNPGGGNYGSGESMSDRSNYGGSSNSSGNSMSSVGAQAGTGNVAADFGGGNTFSREETSDLYLPVLIDMDGDGIEVRQLGQSTTNFDVDDDGYLERVAWTAGDDAVLAFDLNNDGKISEAKEIAFANWTDEDDTDLEALAATFDSNQDKVLDKNDADWDQFKLWQDKDADGVVDDGEMQTLDEAGIRSIGLETRDGTKQVLEDGTIIHGLIDVERENGDIIDGADVALAYNSAGFRTFEDAGGNLVYEFEDGDVLKVKALDVSEQDFDLGDDDSFWIGAKGNDQGNSLDASQKSGAVVLNGDAGNDSLLGGAGNDFLIGGDGTDILKGGDGHDILFADGDDLSDLANIDGGDGYDQIILTENVALSLNADEINVEAILSSDSDDVLKGEKDDVNYAFNSAGGHDVLVSAGGSDRLLAGDGNDQLTGNGGNDSLFGESGDDILDGGEGDDLLAGGEGEDNLNGGAGNDIYYYNRGDGADHIHDFAEGAYKEKYSYEEQVEYQYNVSVQRGSGKNKRWVNETRTGYRMEAREGYRDAFGEIDGGIDTLLFGSGILLSDIVLARANDNMVVSLRDKDDANVISGDQVTIEDWVDEKNRIENFAFADGTKLDFSRIMHGQYGLGENDNLEGSSEGDFLSGGNGNDVLNGHAGRDIMTGGAGDDQMDGGADKDFLFANSGNDHVYGRAGDDYLIGGDGNDVLEGGDGNDALAGQEGDDVLKGGEGKDILLGGTGSDILQGGAGDDTYIYFRGDGKDEILDQKLVEESYSYWTGNYQWRSSGKSGYYVKEYRTGTRQKHVNAGNDTLQFGFTLALEDIFFQTQGEDLHMGVRDRDDANKKLADLDDQLTVRRWAHSENRIETFEFASGLSLDMAAVTHAQSGYDDDDILNGTDGGDILSGGGGNDTLSTGAGDDYLIGGDGDDTLDGGDGKDDLFGGEGDDHLQGGAGEDYLLGGEGDDTLLGGAGKDVLTGGLGDDILKGGLGDDIYIFNRGDGKDTIDETAYGEAQEAYLYQQRSVQSVAMWKGYKSAWVNETRTGYKTVTSAIEGGDDTLQFGANIDISDLMVSMAGDDLVIKLDPLEDGAEITDQVTIKNWKTPEFRVETLRFINDFALDIGEIDDVHTGTDVNDHLQATPIVTQNEVDLTELNRGKFSVNASWNGPTLNKAIDGIFSKSSEAFASNWMEIDMKAEQKLSRLRLVSGYSSDGWNINGVTVQLLDENRQLVHQFDQISGVNYGDWRELSLSENKDARYVRIIKNGMIGLQELQVFGPEITVTDAWLTGGEGDDTLIGFKGNDILNGGQDNDTLEGGLGDDVYIFNRGDGKDVISDSGSSEVGEDQKNPGGDKLLFGADITIEDLILQSDGNDMIVYVKDRSKPDEKLADMSDMIRIKDWANAENRVEVFQFFNGMDFNIAHISNAIIGQDRLVSDVNASIADSLSGTSDGDWLDGFAGNDTLDGLGGEDYLFGRAGDDILNGGDGDDILAGGKDNDTLNGDAGDDILSGGAGDDIMSGGNGKDALLGGTGSDTLNGGAGDDTIVGDKGNDILVASAGTDIYRFGNGDGQDIYQGSTDSGVNGTDIFVFEDGIDKKSVWFERVDNDLVVRLLGSEDSITFQSWYKSDNINAHILGFQAGDDILRYSDVQGLVSAMASFKPNDGTSVYGATSSELPQNVELAVTSAWKAA